MKELESMNIVVVGHVDHGKSTVVGRLMADTDSLPKGKLQQVKDYCEANSRTFEYAYLLDALKDEQAQGITIDSARCFFKTDKRRYIIIDAPGHIEFLKNMVSGAARAEAAILVIDAKEGVQENSKRHGYMLSMLGIKQVVVAVNKMDLIEWGNNRYKEIVNEYSEFLREINIEPLSYIPVSAIDGDNIVQQSTKWRTDTLTLDKEQKRLYRINTIVEAIDGFKKEKPSEELPFRLPVQDIYKFTSEGDDRRFVVGTVNSGTVNVGDKVVFLPSGKKSSIKSIELFNTENRKSATVGEACGYTLTDQIYINKGELMCREDQNLPHVNKYIKANIMWMGKNLLSYNRSYKVKVGSKHVIANLKNISSVLNSSTLDKVEKEFVDRHEVAEILLECSEPISFDLYTELEHTGRFVIIDNYEIAGCGVILSEHESEDKSNEWLSGDIKREDRENLVNTKASFIVITGDDNDKEQYHEMARNMEINLFVKGKNVYYLANEKLVAKNVDAVTRYQLIQQLIATAGLVVEVGCNFITIIPKLSEEELDELISYEAQIMNKM